MDQKWIFIAIIILQFVTIATITHSPQSTINKKECVKELKDFDSYGGVLGTGSMLPSIDKDSVLLYVNVTSNTPLEVGDIVVYGRKNLTSVAHRIVFVDNATGTIRYLIKGDNNYQYDGFIERKDFELKVVGVI